jgi:hypothetical protein
MRHNSPPLSQLSFCRTHLADTFKSFFADVISPPFLASCSVAAAQTAQQRDVAAPASVSGTDRAGYGNTDVIIYARAEAALERGLQRAEVERRWAFEAADLPSFEAVLQQADRQLASAPRYVHVAARDRLKRFAASGRASPLMSTAARH